MKYRRLCPGCWADWIDVDDVLCIMCTHERQQQRPKGSDKRNNRPSEWWGPNEEDLMAADLEPPPGSEPDDMPWGFSPVEFASADEMAE